MSHARPVGLSDNRSAVAVTDESSRSDQLGSLEALLTEASDGVWTDHDVAAAADQINPPSNDATAFAVRLLDRGLHAYALAFVKPLLASGRISATDALVLSEHAASTGTDCQVSILSAALGAYEDAFLYVARAKLLRSAGAVAEAVADAAKAAALAPQHSGIHCENVWTLLAAGRPQDALEAAKVGLSNCPEVSPLTRALAIAEHACGNTAAAETILARSLKNGTSDPETAPVLTDIRAGQLEREFAAFSSIAPGRIDADRIQAIRRRVRELASTDREICARAREALNRLDVYNRLPEEVRTALFDRDFYLRQLPAADRDIDDLVAHFVFCGAQRNLSPTPFFDPSTYRKSVDRTDLPDPLADCLSRSEPGARYHPLAPSLSGHRGSALIADASALEADDPDGSRGPGEEDGSTAKTVERFRFALATLSAASRSHVEHAVGSLAYPETLIDAIALIFDAPFYAGQLRASGFNVLYENLFLHYMREGWRQGFDPHLLFRSSYYISQNPSVMGSNLDPLTHYCLRGDEDSVPHPLLALNKNELRKELEKRGFPRHTKLLIGYLSVLPADRPQFVRFFDADHYKKNVEAVDFTITDPLIHYLADGFRDGVSPHPALDPVIVTKQTGRTEQDGAARSALEIFALSPLPRPIPMALFDPGFYLNRYPDVRNANLCASTHFVQYGLSEGRQANALHMDNYIHSQEYRTFLRRKPPLSVYLSERRHHRRRVVFVGHDGTRTGAPAILYRLVKHFASYDNIECLTILDKGGALVEDYATVSLTYVMSTSRFDVAQGSAPREKYFAEMEKVLNLFGDNPPEIAICNSAEIILHTEFFKTKGIPVIALVHEISSIYPAGELEGLVRNTDKIIFPAQFVADDFHQHYFPSPGQTCIMSQGLLRDTYGDRPSGDRVEVFESAGISVGQDDVIALGVGTIDGRKGFDLFVQTARLVREKHGRENVRFIWIGGQVNWRRNRGAVYDSVGHWASWDTDHGDVTDLVDVISEVSDTEAFLVNADLFLMTSRADPFPCVVQEAMAARLPVLCFANTGGSPEIIGQDAGIVVPYLDCAAMADAIITLADDSVKRREIGEIGRNRVKTEYKFSDYAERVKSLAEAELNVAPDHFGSRTVSIDSGRKILIEYPSEMGVSRQESAITLSIYLKKAGYDAELLVTGEPHKNLLESREFSDIPLRVLHPVNANPEHRQNRLRRYLIDSAPSVFIPGSDIGYQLIRKLPVDIGVLGIAADTSEVQLEQTYRFGRFMDAIVAWSDDIASELTLLNPSFADKIEVVRPVVGALEDDLTAAARAERATASTVRVVVVTGDEVERRRGVVDYGKLLHILARRGVAFEMVIVAEEAEFAGYNHRLRPFIRAGSVQVVKPLGPTEAALLYARSHAYVLMSSSTAAEDGATQAFQYGCGLIAYEGAGVTTELVRHGENGFLVPKGRMEAVADAIEELAGSQARRSAICSQALRTLQTENLTADGMGRRYAAIVSDILESRRTGGRSLPKTSVAKPA